MNNSITNLYTFILFLFLLLIAFTSNWTVFAQDDLKNQLANKRPLLEQQQIKRGEIRSVDGQLLAVSQPSGKGDGKRYAREYPQGELFGNPIGYDFITQGRTGIEQSENGVLVGEENEFSSILEQIQGAAQEGSDLTVTLDAAAQQTAVDELEGRPGSVVAIEPQTGAVRVMASTPGFDPNTIELDGLPEGQPSQLLNRATLGRYPPGSTMKLVTAAAAIDSGEFTPESVLSGETGIRISGVELDNAENANYGDVDLTFALTHSINTVWAQVAEQLGTETMVDYMKKFGFYEVPELDYPDDQMTESGPRNAEGELVESGFDVGRVAIGQGGAEGEMQVAPLQMAEVVAAIANGGRLMKPTFLQQITDPDDRVTAELGPEEQDQVISEESAQQLTEMMLNVTEDPEGTAGGFTVDGAPFPGKTGTAERNIDLGINQPWFVMFAPAKDPQIAVAATVDSCQGCTGGSTAAPIAQAVAEALLG